MIPGVVILRVGIRVRGLHLVFLFIRMSIETIVCMFDYRKE